MTTLRGTIDFYTEMIIYFDDSDESKKHVFEMVDYWGGGKKLISDCGGDVYVAFVKQFMRKAYEFGDDFIREAIRGKAEGFYPLDGEYGIRVINYTNDISYDDVEVEEVYAN